MPESETTTKRSPSATPSQETTPLKKKSRTTPKKSPAQKPTDGKSAKQIFAEMIIEAGVKALSKAEVEDAVSSIQI